MSESENKGNEEIYSQVVRAGKRTYFFDVKQNRQGNYFLCITESIKRLNTDDNRFVYTKHKIFLYKEDFEKFMDGLNTTLDFMINNTPESVHPPREEKTETENYVQPDKESFSESNEKTEENTEENPPQNNFNDISFDDLGK